MAGETVSQKQETLIKNWLSKHGADSEPSFDEIKTFLKSEGIKITNDNALKDKITNLWKQYDSNKDVDRRKQYKQAISTWLKDNDPRKKLDLSNLSLKQKIKTEIGIMPLRNDIYNDVYDEISAEYNDGAVMHVDQQDQLSRYKKLILQMTDEQRINLAKHLRKLTKMSGA